MPSFLTADFHPPLIFSTQILPIPLLPRYRLRYRSFFFFFFFGITRKKEEPVTG
jgi:hypothetical protein